MPGSMSRSLDQGAEGASGDLSVEHEQQELLPKSWDAQDKVSSAAIRKKRRERAMRSVSFSFDDDEYEDEEAVSVQMSATIGRGVHSGSLESRRYTYRCGE